MEATGVVSRQPFLVGFSSSPSSASKEVHPSSASVVMSRRKGFSGGGGITVPARFRDQGHLQYYNSNLAATIRSEKLDKVTKDEGLKKMKKNKLKLLKGLSRDLSSFSQIGFGLDTDCALVDQVKGNMISDAAELLLEQIQKLRAEEKELKKERKEEKAKLKAAQSQNKCINSELSSSSSSESSSDSECGEVIGMSRLKCEKDAILPPTSQVLSLPVFANPQISENEIKNGLNLQFLASISSEPACCSENVTSCVNLCGESRNGSDIATCSKKIEVCMGGKCKKSGAVALLEEFQRVVGIDGAVSGCKCMGKCKDGPNVRMNVFDGGVGDKIVGSPNNPLCIGVDLEDVDMIVANFLGENQNHLEFAT